MWRAGLFLVLWLEVPTHAAPPDPRSLPPGVGWTCAVAADDSTCYRNPHRCAGDQQRSRMLATPTPTCVVQPTAVCLTYLDTLGERELNLFQCTATAERCEAFRLYLVDQSKPVSACAAVGAVPVPRGPPPDRRVLPRGSRWHCAREDGTGDASCHGTRSACREDGGRCFRVVTAACFTLQYSEREVLPFCYPSLVECEDGRHMRTDASACQLIPRR